MSKIEETAAENLLSQGYGNTERFLPILRGDSAIEPEKWLQNTNAFPDIRL